MTCAKLLLEPDFTRTPIDLAGRLGKPVHALSPQQYEGMEIANNANKAELRLKLNEEEDAPVAEEHC